MASVPSLQGSALSGNGYHLHRSKCTWNQEGLVLATELACNLFHRDREQSRARQFQRVSFPSPDKTTYQDLVFICVVT